MTGGLTACAGMSWEPLQFQGPLIEGNKRARSFISCDDRPIGLSDGHYCLIAVEDHVGRKLETSNDISEVINSYLAAVPRLAPWAPDSRGNMRYGNPSGRIPYAMHLLTISPLVVLAVPRVQGDVSDWCNGARQGCIVVRGVQEIVSYQNPPPIREGSFLFSPDLKITGLDVSSRESRIAVPLKTSALVLTANAGTWKVSRD